MKDRDMLELTLKLARHSRDLGSAPVGCVIVDASGEVLSEGRNRACEPWPLESREIAGSSLAHAELAALLHLQEVEDAPGWTLYSSLEPCLMCGGAIGMLGLGRVVWVCDDPWGGAGRLIAWNAHPAFQTTERWRIPSPTSSARPPNSSPPKRSRRIRRQAGPCGKSAIPRLAPGWRIRTHLKNNAHPCHCERSDARRSLNAIPKPT